MYVLPIIMLITLLGYLFWKIWSTKQIKVQNFDEFKKHIENSKSPNEVKQLWKQLTYETKLISKESDKKHNFSKKEINEIRTLLYDKWDKLHKK